MSYRDEEQIKEMKKAEENGTLKRSKKVIMNERQAVASHGEGLD